MPKGDLSSRPRREGKEALAHNAHAFSDGSLRAAMTLLQEKRCFLLSLDEAQVRRALKYPQE